MKEGNFYPNEVWGCEYLHNKPYLEFKRMLYSNNFEIAYELLNGNIVKLTTSFERYEYANILKEYTLNNVANVHDCGVITYKLKENQESFYYVELDYFPENQEDVKNKEAFLQVFRHSCFGKYFKNGTFKDWEKCFRVKNESYLKDIEMIIRKESESIDNGGIIIKMYHDLCAAYREVYHVIPEFQLNLCYENLNVDNKKLVLVI